MIHLAPLLHIENVYNIFMAELMSAIFPKSSPSTLAHTNSFFLSAPHSLIIFYSTPFGTYTWSYFSALCGCLTFPLQCEHLRTDTGVYSSSVLVTFLRKNEAAAGNLTFMKRTGDLSYSISTFLTISSALTWPNYFEISLIPKYLDEDNNYSYCGGELPFITKHLCAWRSTFNIFSNVILTTKVLSPFTEEETVYLNS